MNRMCLAAGVTLIESGSAGYLGQVSVIRKVSQYNTSKKDPLNKGHLSLNSGVCPLLMYYTIPVKHHTSNSGL